MESGTWTWFDHTADIGLAVSAGTLETLFSTSALALFDLLLETSDGRNAHPPIERAIAIDAADPPELLVRWLAELLYLHETEHLIFRRLEVLELTEARLRGMVLLEPFDPARHRVRREIKGVTYHQISVERHQGGWRARLVLDV